MSSSFLAQPKVVLVTGATTGIGAAIVQVLAAKGHRVWGTGRRVETQSPLPGQPGTIALDVTKPDTIQRALDHIVKEDGRLDAVVNNAGIGMMGAMGRHH